jgi:hypothetical protein
VVSLPFFFSSSSRSHYPALVLTLSSARLIEVVMMKIINSSLYSQVLQQTAIVAQTQTEELSSSLTNEMGGLFCWGE